MNRGFRFEWFKAVMQVEGLSATTKNVAGALAIQFANDETGQINPSQETVADYLKVHKDTVKRALRELRNAGWLMSVGDGGRGRSPLLRLLSPSKIVPFRPKKAGQNAPRKHEERGAVAHPKAVKRGDDLQQKGGGITTPHYKEEQYKEQKGEPQTKCPVLSLFLVHASDTSKVEDWNACLSKMGFPSLQQLTIKGGDAQGPGYLLPSRWPPLGEDDQVLLRRYLRWVMDQEEVRYAAQ